MISWVTFVRRAKHLEKEEDWDYLLIIFVSMGHQSRRKTIPKQQHVSKSEKVTQVSQVMQAVGRGVPTKIHQTSHRQGPFGQEAFGQGLSSIMNTPPVPSGHGGRSLVGVAVDLACRPLLFVGAKRL